MLTALTKAILDKDPVLRDTWVSKIPQVSSERAISMGVGAGVVQWAWDCRGPAMRTSPSPPPSVTMARG